MPEVALNWRRGRMVVGTVAVQGIELRQVRAKTLYRKIK